MNFKNILYTFLIILISSTTTLAVSTMFNDVDYNSWYGPSVGKLNELGIIKGYNDGSFKPNDKVNRAEIAVMMDRMLQYIENGKVTLEEIKVTFDMPEGWISDDSFDTYDKLAYYNPKSYIKNDGYQEGIIFSSEIENPNNLDLFTYYEAELSKCEKENPTPDNIEELGLYISPCWSYHFNEEDWTQNTINGHKVFRSKALGIPESGELMELLYVQLDNKFVKLMAVYSGMSLETAQPKIKEIFDSVRVE